MARTTVTILGAGAMGTALATPLADNGHKIRIWGTAYDDAVVTTLQAGAPHPALGAPIPAGVEVLRSSELARALEASEIAILATSSAGVESTVSEAALHMTNVRALVIVTKGLLDRHGEWVTIPEGLEPYLAARVLPPSLVAVGGPSIAREVACRVPTAVVYASRNAEVLAFVKGAFETAAYRVGTTRDVTGVELAAATKNIYAIAAGICDGLGQNGPVRYHNTRSALFALALREMSALAAIAGGDRETAYGLAGAGDLEVTCLGGRNGVYGARIGKGETPEAALADMNAKGLTVEGHAATQTVREFVRQFERRGRADLARDFPLLAAVHRILFEGAHAREAILEFFARI